jgi:hypothetical protein
MIIFQLIAKPVYTYSESLTMSNNLATIKDLVILSGTQNSRSVAAVYETADANLIGILSPATLPDTVTIEVSHDDTTFATLNNGTADVAAPAAGKACVYDQLVFPYWRLHAAAPTAADRTFKVSKNYLAER